MFVDLSLQSSYKSLSNNRLSFVLCPMHLISIVMPPNCCPDIPISCLVCE